MTFNYAASRKTAEDLIALFGKDATLHKITSAGNDWEPTRSETDTTVKAVDLSGRFKDASGTLVGQSSRTLYVSTSASVVPDKDDEITVDGKRHVIKEVRTLNPGGTVIMHEVDLVI